MMDWRENAYDRATYDPNDLESETECSYYLAKPKIVTINVTMLMRQTCWANTIFRPCGSFFRELRHALNLRWWPESTALNCVAWILIVLPLSLPFLMSMRPFLVPLDGRRDVRVFLWLVPIAWYLMLYHSLNFAPHGLFYNLLGILLTIAALIAAAIARRAGGGIFAVPLLIAIIFGTVWRYVLIPVAI
jgi:hypothetical protein